MTMTLHTKASGMALLHQIQGNELEPLNRPQLKMPMERALGEVYVDNSKPPVFNYPEGAAYEFNAAAAAAASAPVYGQSGIAYGPGSEAAAFGANSLGGFPQLNSVSPSPLMLLHPPPQLSPFLHPHGQQVPYYLENEPSAYAVRDTGPPAFYRYPRQVRVSSVSGPVWGGSARGETSWAADRPLPPLGEVRKDSLRARLLSIGSFKTTITTTQQQCSPPIAVLWERQIQKAR